MHVLAYSSNSEKEGNFNILLHINYKYVDFLNNQNMENVRMCNDNDILKCLKFSKLGNNVRFFRYTAL